jgi:hypothetical protein
VRNSCRFRYRPKASASSRSSETSDGIDQQVRPPNPEFGPPNPVFRDGLSASAGHADKGCHAGMRDRVVGNRSPTAP